MKKNDKIDKSNSGAKSVVGISATSQHFWAGPLPSPQILREFNEIVPGSADRIITMAEKQEDHRIEIESKVIESNIRNEKLGVISGLVIGLAGLSCATICALYGHDWVAGIIGGSTLVSLVSVFVIGKSKREKELSQKSE
jgi:uncharacterized membrane protein